MAGKSDSARRSHTKKSKSKGAKDSATAAQKAPPKAEATEASVTMRLKKQILLLQEYRKNGVKTLAEAELYDAEKKKRELDQAIQKQRDSASYLYESHYLVIKDALVRECYRLGYLTKKMAKETVQIDVNTTGHIYDFFVKCGWVKSENATPTVSSSLKTKSPKKGKKPAVEAVNSALVIANKEGQSVTPAKRKAAEMEAGTKL
ncbi:Ferric reduction oxidase 6 [Phytophthora nicotianae]|uniref:Ferric reduction oxidase 6 n=1 Tax=Phytophthora nicotianae TaxID=4792 RepID=A0A0W8CW56_PHYNI|nr:Ferric reduction oxidase 6 [Phytophthora nicotianae]